MRNTIIIFILLIAGCTSIKIATSWKSPEVAVITPVKNIIVLAIINEKDKRFAARMEAHFVGDLTDLGYKATSALQLYGPKAFDSLTEKNALIKVSATSADLILTIVLLNKSDELKYIPGQTIYTGGDIWQSYPTQGRTVYEPGHMVNEANYFWETNLYEQKTKKLLYSVQTNAYNPKGPEALGHEYSSRIIADMIKNKVVQQYSLKEE